MSGGIGEANPLVDIVVEWVKTGFWSELRSGETVASFTGATALWTMAVSAPDLQQPRSWVGPGVAGECRWNGHSEGLTRVDGKPALAKPDTITSIWSAAANLSLNFMSCGRWCRTRVSGPLPLLDVKSDLSSCRHRVLDEQQILGEDLLAKRFFRGIDCL